MTIIKSLELRIKNRERGFTLIELLIVFSILTIISMIGIAGLVTYSRSQTLTNTYNDVKTVLTTARASSLAQLSKPTHCPSGPCACPVGQQFGGYQVLFCCASSDNTNGCPKLAPNNCISSITTPHYELNILCGGSKFNVDNKSLPANVSFNTSSSSRSYVFSPITGAVTGAGTIMVTSFNQTKTVIVNSSGLIQ